MKTYFQYEGIIKSKDSAEAIASAVGIGPFCGFGSADISDSGIVIKPEAEGLDKIISTNVKDRLLARVITKDPEDEYLNSANTNFGCISRDGYVFVSNEETINIEGIQGSKSQYEEVLVFAVHSMMKEPVDNPVTFVAYWNNSGTSFYDYYKRSLDVYYPLAEDQRSGQQGPDITKEVTSDFNYEKLLGLVQGAIGSAYEPTSYVLIGIYGKGMDAIKKVEEKFAIVPYNGKVSEIPFTSATYSQLKESLKRIEKNTSGFPFVDSENGGDKEYNIKDYIDEQIKQLEERLNKNVNLSILPIGSIILWAEDEIPEGWADYSKAAGRIVIGYQAGGININDSQYLQVVGDMYKPVSGDYYIKIKGGDLPKHRHAIGVSIGGQDNSHDAEAVRPQSFANRQMDLNGDHGYKGETKGIQNGTIVSSYNLQGEAYTIESTTEVLNIEKLPPTITLRYIQKQ